MNKKKTCSDGTVIEYRLPNVIELLELKHEAGFGQDGTTGYSMIAKILKSAEPFIKKIDGKKNWKACLESRVLAEDLSELALSLTQDDLEPEEKKA